MANAKQQKMKSGSTPGGRSLQATQAEIKKMGNQVADANAQKRANKSK